MTQYLKGGGGGTKHFFLLILYNFKNIWGGACTPRSLSLSLYYPVWRNRLKTKWGPIRSSRPGQGLVYFIIKSDGIVLFYT